MDLIWLAPAIQGHATVTGTLCIHVSRGVTGWVKLLARTLGALGPSFLQTDKVCLLLCQPREKSFAFCRPYTIDVNGYYSHL
jgi:hypothetical protein